MLETPVVFESAPNEISVPEEAVQRVEVDRPAISETCEDPVVLEDPVELAVLVAAAMEA